jgi:hypothetical protein
MNSACNFLYFFPSAGMFSKKFLIFTPNLLSFCLISSFTIYFYQFQYSHQSLMNQYKKKMFHLQESHCLRYRF